MLLASAALAATVGCQRGPDTALVAGSVTLDGQPLDDARIEFDPGDGTVGTSLDVTQGAFSGEVETGLKTVRIFAMRKSKPDPRLKPTDVQNPFDNILPHRYGYDSTVKITVGTDDTTALQYNLTSK
ncbi:MAG: hypothetical protein AAF790_10820 [Planctomycetota bacterium]